MSKRIDRLTEKRSALMEMIERQEKKLKSLKEELKEIDQVIVESQLDEINKLMISKNISVEELRSLIDAKDRNQ